ncbi:MAG: aminotransferase class I/II-fold pyridoxal phosphate-dependent enzyme [Pseudomonadales bacterium]|nr:aminotransferase class I/II-fold pyridoxal phosphate-dependent enzyme [Pseudomonadales bacterium]
MNLNSASPSELKQIKASLLEQLASFTSLGLALDLTRGKPSAQQLSLSNALGNIDVADFKDHGVDTRNYGGLYGTDSARQLGAEILDVLPEETLAGGNSSLTLMYQSILFAYLFGPGDSTPWKNETTIRFLCPSPGYDRHFAICEEFGIEMIAINMTENGPDMDQVENLIKTDPSIRGMWCVPKYSNPTGCIYSDETVERIARLGLIAHKGFRIFWDNAYAVHDLVVPPRQLASLMQCAKKHGTEQSVYLYSSTSKVTFAGSGIAFFAATKENLASFSKHLGIATIGPDKVNQLKHTRFISDMGHLHRHMQKHAELLKPRFEAVLNGLEKALGLDGQYGVWSRPEGGYFISFDTLPGLASEVVSLTEAAGVKLTPAGATFPYGKDPEDKNIRLAPSFASIEDIKKAIEVFTVCVRLATVNKRLTD